MNRLESAPAPAAPSANGNNGHDQPSRSGSNGRDARGRFAPGNKGGFGNPFARQTAALRCAMLAAVTADDMAVVTHQLFELARSGNLAAIRLFLSYMVGKAAPATDPDTLDVHEWGIIKQALPMGQELADVCGTMTPEHLALYGRSAQELSSNQILLERFEELAEMKEDQRKDAERAEKARQRAQARREARKAQAATPPSPNGDNGQVRVAPAETAAPRPPSANGVNGDAAVPRPSPDGGNGPKGPVHRPSPDGDNGDRAAGPPSLSAQEWEQAIGSLLSWADEEARRRQRRQQTE